MEFEFLFILLQVVQSVSVTVATNFQVIAGYSGSNTCFTIFSGQSGWAAIGIGSSSMSGADVYIGWKNTTGGTTLANLKSTGHSQPGVNSVQNAWVVPLMSTAPSWSTLSFSFCRPTVVSAGATITSTVPYIFASCPYAPSSPNSISSGFSQHQSIFGSFNIDATATNLSPSNQITPSTLAENSTAVVYPSNTNSAPPANTLGLFETGQSGQTGNTGSGRSNQPILTASDSFPYSNIVAVHGCIMFFAWCVCPALGIFIARYLKSLGHLWFLLHVGLAITTTVCTVVGFLLIFLYYTPPHFAAIDFIAGSHTRWGLFILIGMFCQVLLGVASDKLFSPSRTRIPWWDVAHWWLGRIIFCLAQLNVFSGIGLFSTEFGIDESLVTLYWVFLFSTVALFIYGETHFGQVHHVSEAKATKDATIHPETVNEQSKQ